MATLIEFLHLNFENLTSDGHLKHSRCYNKKPPFHVKNMKEQLYEWIPPTLWIWLLQHVGSCKAIRNTLDEMFCEITIHIGYSRFYVIHLKWETDLCAIYVISSRSRQEHPINRSGQLPGAAVQSLPTVKPQSDSVHQVQWATLHHKYWVFTNLLERISIIDHHIYLMILVITHHFALWVFRKANTNWGRTNVGWKTTASQNIVLSVLHWGAVQTSFGSL